MRSGSGALIFLLGLATAWCQTRGQTPLVAFSSGNSIVLLSKSGEVVSSVKLPIEVGEFAFSPDLKKLVLVSAYPPDGAGGKMYLYTVESKQIQRIPAQAVLPGSARSEVYSDPQFSVDGARVFFLVHPQAEGDLADTSGPIAELDLKSLRARRIWSNAGDDTDGAMLSPSGREILLWDPMMVIDTNGKTQFDLHDFQLVDSFKWARDVAWIGNGCVLYQAGKSTNSWTGKLPNSGIKGDVSYFVLNLKTLKSASTIEKLQLSDKDLDGLVSYRFPYAVTRTTSDSADSRRLAYFLVSSGGTRVKLNPGDVVATQVLPNSLEGSIPADCR